MGVGEVPKHAILRIEIQFSLHDSSMLQSPIPKQP